MKDQRKKAGITTVIFDIGNVLMRFGWMDRVIALYGESIGKAVTRAIWEDGRWEDMDLGIAGIDVIQERAIAAHPEIAEEIREMIAHASEVFFAVDYAIPWVQELKEAGYRVLYLSNYSKFNFEVQPEETLGFLPFMDGGIFSCDVGMIKPDPAIFGTLCSAYTLLPEECLFIDDTKVNIEAAHAFGMQAIQFIGYEKTYPEVMECLKSGGLK